ncbi:hypothetical protein H632_c419p2 [Helicosporidium sp. ATCC 50920]|nr:hypothetical protein H632_c419p2 [Helicosporidium sp. ATCC 50920]|eukprot:KDD75956.1 hypothetical protein H632_c419p2 [Helicosporidium sp. ATCC 50920]
MVASPADRVAAWSKPEPEMDAADRRVLDLAVAEQAETTNAAQRAAKVAAQTVDVASNTLVELHRQGEQLDNIDIGLHQLEEDVDEANAVVKFMQRYCCLQLFTCCAYCDPNQKRDRSRGDRMKKRRALVAQAKAERAQKHVDAAAMAANIGRKSDPAFNGSPEAARKELMDSPHGIRAQPTSRQAPNASGWEMLPEGDREELMKQHQMQEGYLDSIEGSIAGMKALSLEIKSELDRQDGQLDKLPDQMTDIEGDLKSLTRQAGRL